MAKVKMSKNATSIDMTAMCDVAFLLLTFFILTATAKTPEALPVQTPNSTVQTKLPDTDLATITLGTVEGKDQAFFGVLGKQIRIRTLELMGEKYSTSFTDEEKEEFSRIESFGTPVEGLKQLIAMKNEDRNKKGVQPGIPKDSPFLYKSVIAVDLTTDVPIEYSLFSITYTTGNFQSAAILKASYTCP